MYPWKGPLPHAHNLAIRTDVGTPRRDIHFLAAGNLETDSFRNPRVMNLFTHFTELEVGQVVESNLIVSISTVPSVAFRDLPNLQFREVGKQIHHSRITKGINLQVTSGIRKDYVEDVQHVEVLEVLHASFKKRIQMLDIA
jgi:hypothetical protein